MEDTNKFFEGVLGISDPWEVIGVERDEDAEKVTVTVEFDRSRAGFLGGHLHGYVERKWRHLNTCQYETVLCARVPRVKHPDGTTSELKVPWADRFCRVTKMMEAHAIKVLKAARSHSAAAELLGMGEGQLNRIMARAVARGMKRREDFETPHIGVDEKAIRRGHNYASILNDITQGIVIDLVEGRDGKAASNLFNCLSESQKGTVEAVAMDMWKPYMKSAGEEIPDADIVHDRFHIAQYLGKAVDIVRRAENKALLGDGDESLKGTKYDWLRRVDDLRTTSTEFRDLYKSALQTAKAWGYKQLFDQFWNYVSEPWAKKFFDRWYRSAIHTKLAPIKKVAKMLKKHLKGLLAYTRHRITNATAEGLNSKIQTIRANARGLPKFANFRIRVLFHCGGLDLSPHTV